MDQSAQLLRHIEPWVSFFGAAGTLATFYFGYRSEKDSRKQLEMLKEQQKDAKDQLEMLKSQQKSALEQLGMLGAC